MKDDMPPIEKIIRAAAKAAVAFLIILALANSMPKAHAFFDFGGGGGGGFAGATEITQLLNNVELGLQTVEDYAQTLELIETKYLTQLQQLAQSVGEFSAPFQKAYDTYQRVKEVHSKLATLQGNLKNLDGALEGRFKEFANSRFSTWREWAEREKTKIAQGDANARAKIQANQRVLESTQDSIQAYQEALQRLNSSTGVHGATQMNGAILGQIGMDLNKMIASIAQANVLKGLEQQEKIAAREAERADMAALRKKQKDVDEARARELDQALLKRKSSQ